jgi:hypothetical protein
MCCTFGQSALNASRPNVAAPDQGHRPIELREQPVELTAQHVDLLLLLFNLLLQLLLLL